MAPFNDPRRVIGNVIQLGTVETVDLGEATCTVRVGDIVTTDVAWLAPRAGQIRIWSPPSIGEQCILLCPEGDMEGGIAVLGLFSDANPAPSTEDIELIRFGDGAILSYDAAAHELIARLPAGGKARVDAPGGLTITGPVKITGRVEIDGDLSGTGTATWAQDVVGGSKSLKDHIHTKVQAGGAVSGPPQ